MEKIIEETKISFFDEDGNEVMYLDHSTDECIWFFNSDKPLFITNQMPLYSVIDFFMSQDYLFANDILQCYKDSDKLIWYSDCYYNPDDDYSLASVSKLTIEKEKDSYKIYCSKKLDEIFNRTNKSYCICFSPCGNGKYAKNVNTGYTLQDDFVVLVYQALLNRSKER